jgi:hypothetical protein
MTTATPGTHAHFAEDTALATVVPLSGPATLPRPSDLARIASLQNNSQPSAPESLHEDPEKGLESESTHTPDIYDKYTKRQKNRITAIVSFASLLARESSHSHGKNHGLRARFVAFASSSFLPSIPQLAVDMHTSRSTIDYTVCIYLVVLGIAYVDESLPSAAY